MSAFHQRIVSYLIVLLVAAYGAELRAADVQRPNIVSIFGEVERNMITHAVQLGEPDVLMVYRNIILRHQIKKKMRAFFIVRACTD